MNSALPAPLEAYLLGLVDFEEIQLLQRRLVYEYGERPGGALILCEHPPTISVGRAGSRLHVRADDDELRSWGIRTRWVNRGGGCTLHMPGQLTAYLVLPLEPLGLGVGQYLDGLTRVIVGVLEDFDLGRTARPGPSGVDLAGERVATLGIAVRRWIAYYGLTLNVGPFLAPFALLDEPDAAGQPVQYTSMEAVRQRPAPMSRVRESLLRHIEGVFGLERHVLFTSHPMIGRRARPDVLAQTYT